jgi:hypothetical protein
MTTNQAEIFSASDEEIAAHAELVLSVGPSISA